MRKNTFEWFRLDNAAKIFPGQNSQSWSNIFRLGVQLKQEVDPELLQTALEKTLKRIPTFNVVIRKGFFWFYFKKNPNEAEVKPDIRNICYRVKFNENKGFLFRLYYHGDRVNLEVYHALCDGYGAMVFLSTLIAEYLRLQGHSIPSNQIVLDIDEKPRAKELEDSYGKYADSKVKYNRKDKWVYHPKGTKAPRHYNYYTSGTMSFAELRKIAKSYGATVTELLAAMLIDVHYKKQLAENKKQREICIQVPVNLRKAFPSESLRNFVLCLRVKIDPNLGEYTFEEIIRSVSLQLKLANDPKLLNSLMTQNLKIERNPVAKFLPLAVKNLGVGVAFMITAEQTTTSLLSNLGPVVLPEEMIPHIEKYYLYTGAGIVNSARCGVVSFGDKLVFTFSNCHRESDIEREFFTRLVKMGVHVKIESNRN